MKVSTNGKGEKIALFALTDFIWIWIFPEEFNTPSLSCLPYN